MKKNDYSVWIFTLPSGLEIHLRDVPQQDIDFLNNVEQLRAKVAELEAKLEKYENLEPACWMTPDGEGWRMRTKPPENDVPLGWMPLYALEK